MATTVSRRFAGFVKVKHKRKAVPLPKRTNVLPENDRLVGEAPSRPTAPLMARPVPKATPGSRYKVLLAALAAVGVAVVGAMVLKSAVAPYISSPSVSRVDPVSSPRSHKRAPSYGDYPGNRGEFEPTSGPTPSNEESFLAAGYVRSKPQLADGSAMGGSKGSAGSAGKAAEARQASSACVVKMDGGVLPQDFGACLRQIDGK